MTAQLAMIEAEPKLTAQQRLVLDRLRAAGTDGLHTDEAGAIAHSAMESRWRHSDADRCQWCGKRGKEILGRLRVLGLARYRGRLRVWQATGEFREGPLPGMLRDDQPIPF